MADKDCREGKVSFSIPSRDEPCETFYKIYGNLDSEIPPVIILHGGPGSGHEYMEPYSGLWYQYGIPVVFYDQIGCAASTHLRERVRDKSFWVPDLFVAELENLITKLRLDRREGPGFHVLGHSMGGTFAVVYAARQPKGLLRLVLHSSNSSSQALKRNVWELSKNLAPEHQQAIKEAVEKEDFTLPAYLAAMKSFGSKYKCRANPPPPPLLANNRHQAEDRTSRTAMQGRSSFTYDGSMEFWSNLPFLSKINVPTLVFHGEFDTATHESVVPYFDHIQRVRMCRINGGSHMAHLDSPELLQEVLQLVGRFLKQSESSASS